MVRSAAGEPREVVADHYVCALPVEVMARLVGPELGTAAPSLARLDRVETRLMGGVQLFFDRPLALNAGHLHLADAAWGLTAIAQAQFWPGTDLGWWRGDRVGDVLSVCIADWRSPGTHTTRLPAASACVDAIAAEVLAQLRSHLGPARRGALDGARLLGWAIDPRIADPATRGLTCEPLLVHTLGSWHDRPEAATPVENLVLAGDHVRTWMDLATMKAANESARRAVNAILDRCGEAHPPCRLVAPRLPAPLSALRRLDEVLYRRAALGRPRLHRRRQKYQNTA